MSSCVYKIEKSFAKKTELPLSLSEEQPFARFGYGHGYSSNFIRILEYKPRRRSESRRDCCGLIGIKPSYNALLAKKRFIPSSELIRLIKERIADVYSASEVDRQANESNLSQYITRTFNGTIANLSKRYKQNNKYVPYLICKDGRLNNEFRNTLINRFGLDIDDLKPLVDTICRELTCAAKMEVDNAWGKIYWDSATNSVFGIAKTINSARDFNKKI